MKTTKLFPLLAFLSCSIVGALAACGSETPSDGLDESELGTAAGPVLTQHNNNMRTGVYKTEHSLTPATVTASTFGKLFSLHIDGEAYAQPLFVRKAIGVHNVLYVATENNSVYAFDSDNGQQLWKRSLGPAEPATDLQYDGHQYCGGVHPVVGITSTPVIDLGNNSNTMYVVAKTKENGAPLFRIHALNIIDGSDRMPSTVIDGSITYPGTGAAAHNGVIAFDPLRQLNRAGLLLVNGVVYVAFGSNCDFNPFHGWLFGYDAKTLKHVSKFLSTPNGAQGGIWHGGGGLVSDVAQDGPGVGSIYLASGNGSAPSSGAHNYGQSLLKLNPHPDANKVLSVASSFTPTDFAAQNHDDQDMGGGPLLMPGTDLMAASGKAGNVYVVHRDNMGGLQPGGTLDPQIVQRWHESTPFGLAAQMLYWDTGKRLYAWPGVGQLRSYHFDGTKFDTTPVQSNVGLPSGDGQLSMSVNGVDPSTAILWASHHSHLSNGSGLFAFNPITMATLWHSDMIQGDQVGARQKFAVPTIANGKVYLATADKTVVVYGHINGGNRQPYHPGGGTDAGSTPPPPKTWTEVFNGYLTTGTVGHCTGCHNADVANAPGGFHCKNKDDCWQGLKDKHLIDFPNPGLLDPTRTPLIWLGHEQSTGMPAGWPAHPSAQQSAEGTAAARAIEGWLEKPNGGKDD